MDWYSSSTGRAYPDQEAMVAEEGHGWVVLGIFDKYPVVVGIYPTKKDAVLAKNRLKTRWKRNDKVVPDTLRIRPVWDEQRHMPKTGRTGPVITMKEEEA